MMKAISFKTPVARSTRLAAAKGADSVLSNWYGPSRNTFVPDLDPPKYLDGTMAGDHGYDPLGIGEDPQILEQYRKGEILNGRFAMLGALGMILPEILAANGFDIKGANWLRGSAEMLNGGKLDYLGIPNPLTLNQVLVVNSLLVFGAEWWRVYGRFPDGTAPADPVYPGFDPLGLADDPEAFELRKVNEIRNGRLAMMGFLGFVVQGYFTGEGPWANFTRHIADPQGYNILTVLGGE